MTSLDDPHTSYRLIARELEARGFTCQTAKEDQKMYATFTSPQGMTWKTRIPKLRYPFTSPSVQRLFDSKAHSYVYASKQGFPVPFTRRVSRAETINDVEMNQLLEQYKTLIVKPDNSSSSKGLTLGIETVDELKEAIEVAQSVRQSDILVQQQVSGEEIRFIIAKGKVIGALLRQTPRIVGDGKSTVAQLIFQENSIRSSLKFNYIEYPLLDESIIDAKCFTDTTVPISGEVVELSRATMIRNGCSVYEVKNKVHPSYVKEIERMAYRIESQFFVADFLLDDYTIEAQHNNHWFLEFNTSPALKLCYGARDGNMLDVVPIVSELIEDSLK